MAVGDLPPGFRFFPTDEELVAHYLRRKVFRGLQDGDVIGELDLYKFEPWDLPGLSVLRSRDGQWYFFAPRDRRNVGSSRTSRATKVGYWKATGRDRKVCHKSCTVGMKKTLVYHEGRAPRGLRTNWVMHEYRIDEAYERDNSVQSGFVVCKIFQKGGPGPRNGEQYGAPVEDEDENCKENGYLSETREEEETQPNLQTLLPPFAVKQEEEKGENEDLLTHLLEPSPFGLDTNNSLDNLFPNPIPELDNVPFIFSPFFSGLEPESVVPLPTSSAEAEEEASILDELLLTAEASENSNSNGNSNNNNDITINSGDNNNNYNYNNNNDIMINSGDDLDIGDYLELDDLDWPLSEDAEVENESSGIEIRQRSGEPRAAMYAEFPQRVRLQIQTQTQTNTSSVHYARRHLPSSEVRILTPRELGVFRNPQRVVEEYNLSRTNLIHEDTLSRRGSDNFSEYSSLVNEKADSSDTASTSTTTSTSTSTPFIPETCSPSTDLGKKEIASDPNSGPCTKPLWKSPFSKAASGTSASAFCMLQMRDFGLLQASEMLSKKPSSPGFCGKSILGIGGFFGPAKEAIVSLTVKIAAFVCPFYNYSA